MAEDCAPKVLSEVIKSTLEAEELKAPDVRDDQVPSPSPSRDGTAIDVIGDTAA